MAFLPFNRCLQVSLHLQIRCLLIPSSCFRAMTRHESSGPVRYIPGEYTKMKKVGNPRLLDSSNENEEAKSSKNGSFRGVSVAPKMPEFDDYCYQNELLDANDSTSSDVFEHIEDFSQHECDDDTSLELMEADVKNDFEPFLKETTSSSDTNMIAERNEKIDSRVKQDAEKTAIELLAARAFTVLELRKKLRGKRYPLNVVDSVVASIKDRGLLNDGLYAESFSRSRWRSSTWGPKRIKQALIQKGVNAMEVDKAMKQVFEEDDSIVGDCQNMQHGMSKASLDRLYLQVSKQWLRGQTASLENRKSRIIRWLQYRGFSWGVTSIILRRLVAEHPP